MKKIILGLVVFGVIGIGMILGQQFYNVGENVPSSETSDVKISLVREFWQSALDGNDTEKFISTTPKKFYSNERCTTNDLNETEDGNVPRKIPTVNDSNTKQLRKLAKIIGEKKYTIVNTKIIRSLEKEAIIEARYTKGDPNWTENFYFFMISTNGDWKVFHISKILIDDQEDYAKDCK
jgi:hypothetical protein